MSSGNAGEASQRDIPLRDGSPLQEGQKLNDALSGREFVVKNGRIQVDIPSKTALILVAH